MFRSALLAVALLVLAPTVQAQPAPPPCSSEEARQLDFWIGEWELSWEGGSGTNEIRRRFGDCVIEENFAGDMPAGEFLGHSVSVYDVRRGEWRQTWVDNRGGYLVFRGGLDDEGVMRLYGEPRELPDGRTQLNRMSWLNVTADSLDWQWERSFDGGESWEMAWAIHYSRR